MKLTPSVLFVAFTLLFIPLSLASFEIDNPSLPRIKPPPQTIISFNNDTGAVNSSQYADIWITAEGDKDDVSDILTSELTDDNTYVEITGDDMTGDLNMTYNDIFGVKTLTIENGDGYSAYWQEDGAGYVQLVNGIGGGNFFKMSATDSAIGNAGILTSRYYTNQHTLGGAVNNLIFDLDETHPEYISSTGTHDFTNDNIVTTGSETIGTTNDEITLNDANSKFHIYGSTTNDYGKVDTGIDFQSVAIPDYPTLANLGAGNVDAGVHYYQVEFYTAWGGTGVKSYASAPSINLAGNSEVRVTIPVSTDYRVIGRKIYRTKAGGGPIVEYLLADVPNNVDTYYDDNIPDASLPADRAYAYSLPNTAVPMLLKDGVGAVLLDTKGTVLGAGAKPSGQGVVIGSLAGANLQASALNNILLGQETGYSMTTGTSNVLIGYRTGNSMTTSTSNTAVGYSALQVNTGSYNVGIGNYAGRYGSGSYNVLIGNNAGRGSSWGTSARNIGIGNGALENMNNAGLSYNIALGWTAGDSITTGTYNILMGYDAQPSSPTASNEMVISSINSVNFGGANITTAGVINGSSLIANDGYTGTCINTTFVNGIATGCND